MPEIDKPSNQRPYGLVVFDFDGTLADTFGWFMEALDVSAEKFGFSKAPANEHETLRGWTFSEISRHLGVPTWKVPRVAHFMRKKMQVDIETISAFDGVKDLLVSLDAAGVKLGLVSSNSWENIEAVLGAKASLFVHRSCGVSIFGKATKLRKILSASGTRPENALFVGDELRDEEAARAVGMKFGAVAWGYNRPDVLRQRHPDEWFETVQEMASVLV
jgi:phosphoglycolate phosphatase